MMDSVEDSFAQVRLAAGGLFVRGEEVLLVHTTDGGGWQIPGGYVESGESPAAACRREIREELGIDRPAQRLLVHDWAPSADDGDKIVYIFDCGVLGDEKAVELQPGEFDRWQWVRVDTLDDFVVPRLARRLWHAFRARLEDRPLYLEHGRTALAYPSADAAPASWLDRQADRDRHLG
ncbi:NUDIX domain-containing protein [Nocardia sp. NBC_01009]|uniref:NUDIX domain-containing protein n=1 Tax=Nocardia sp. NBC_01009 TaxID=2975996 RepID=UPI00386982B8|nr:NUDIX hydrolase [Nocardia sp. NBC_01009]